MKSRSKKKGKSEKLGQDTEKVLYRYIRDKVNQLLETMGTKPLREEELDERTIVEFDPIGIIAESFKEILEHLREKNLQLQQARDYLQAVFDAVGVGISIVDRDLKIIKCNERQKELLVRDTDTVEGRHCYEVYCGIDSPPLICPAIETIERNREVFLKEVTKKGRIFQINTSPLRDKEGNITGVVEVSVDITDKKRTEDALHQAEKLAAVGRLAAGIAHELNNPLGNIIGYAKLLLKTGNLGDYEREKLSVIIEQAEKGSEIIKGLLEFSHERPLELKRVFINDFIERVLSTMAHIIESSGIKIFKYLNDIPPLEADQKQIEQVLYNILLNAVQALEGRKDGIIEIRTSGLDSTVQISISDNGPGIPREHLSLIFDPFFTTKPPGKGTGLGLSISSEIVKKHGGSLWVESEIGKGTTFHIILPVKTKIALNG
ncbi:MAG: two-component system sensor histidine kinase NtrB [Thermodesulfovibrionales bacterium]